MRWLKISIAALVILILVGVAYWFVANKAENSNKKDLLNTAVAVNGITIKPKNFSQDIFSAAIVQPSIEAVVRARVPGILQKYLVKQSEQVKQGQSLAQIDAISYQLQVQHTKGAYQQALAQVQNAKNDLQRYNALYAQNAISKQQYDTQKAMVQQLQGGLQQAQAEKNQAALQLKYATVTAPISGQLSLTKADAGNLLKEGDEIFTIVQTQPMLVRFSIAEQQLMTLRQAMTQNPALPLEAWDRNNQTLLAKGVLQYIDNQIDQATGSIKLQASFANQQQQLFPNQFVNLKLKLQQLSNVIVLPLEIVRHDAQGNYVYIYDVTHKQAQKRRVTLGVQNTVDVVITQGLQPADIVIVEGIDRLRNEMAVNLVVLDDEPTNTAKKSS